ncbi:MAG: RHS repeat-associated core domain-containing protein [Planctomycetaceae bacterium]
MATAIERLVAYDVPPQTSGQDLRQPVNLQRTSSQPDDDDGDPLYYVSVTQATGTFGSFQNLNAIPEDGALDFYTLGRSEGSFTGSPIRTGTAQFRITDGHSFSPILTTQVTTIPNRSLSGSELFGIVQTTGTFATFAADVTSTTSAATLTPDWRLTSTVIGLTPDRSVTSAGGVAVDLETGDASFDYALFRPVNGSYGLHYDSGAARPRPVVQSVLHRPAATEKVTEVRATLRWAKYEVKTGGLSLTDLDLDNYATAIHYQTPAGLDSTEIAVTLQASAKFGTDVGSGVLATGLYRWFVDTTMYLSNGTIVKMSSTGDTFVQSPQANPTSPFRGLPTGWTVSGVSNLFIQPNDQTAMSLSDRIKDDQVMLVFPDGGVRRFKAPATTTNYASVQNGAVTESHSDPWRAITMENRLSDLEVFGKLVRISTDGTNSWGVDDTWLYTAVDGTTLRFNKDGNVTSIYTTQLPATTFGYNPAGLISTITSPDQAVIEFVYDGNNKLDTIKLPGNASEPTRTIDMTDLGSGNFQFAVSDAIGVIERFRFNYDTNAKVSQILWGDVGSGDVITQITYNADTGAVSQVLDGGAPVATVPTYTFKAQGLFGWTANTVVWTGGSVNWTLGTTTDLVLASDARAESVAPAVNGQKPVDVWHLDRRGRIAQYQEYVAIGAARTLMSQQSWDRNAFGATVEQIDELGRATRFTRDYSTNNDGSKPVYYGSVTEVFYGYPQATTRFLSTDDGGYIAQALDARQIASAVYFDNKNRARISGGADGTTTRWVFNDVPVPGGIAEGVLTSQVTTWKSSKLKADGSVDADKLENVTQTTNYTGYQLDRLPRTITSQDNRGSDINVTTLTYTPSGEVLQQTNSIAGTLVSTTDFTYFGHNNAVKSSIVKDSQTVVLAKQEFTYYTRGLTKTSFDGLGYSNFEYNDRGLPENVRAGAPTATDFTSAYLTTYDYHDNGAVKTMTAPDGHKETTSFDLAARTSTVTTDRVKATGVDLVAGSTVQTVSSGYDIAGRTTFVSDSLAGSSIDYAKFDHYDRLLETSDRVFLQAAGSPVFVKNTYTYDAAGNLLQSKLHGDTNSNPNDAGLAPMSYDYDRFGYTSRYEVVALGGAVMEMQNDAAGQTIRGLEYRKTPTLGGSGVTGYTESPIISQGYFDGYGRLRRSEAPEGNSVQLAYSMSDTEIPSLGGTLFPTVTATTFLRNGTATPDQIQSTSWSDALGRSLASKDPSGTIVHSEYYLSSRMTDTRLLIPNGSGGFNTLRQSRSTVDTLGRPLTQTDVDPNTFSLGSGPQAPSQEVRYQYPTQANYDTFATASAATYWDARWDVSVSNRVSVNATGTIPQSRFANDSLGNSVRTDAPDPDAGGPLAAPVTRSDYDYSASFGYSATTIDPLGRHWKTDLNSRGQVLQTFDASTVQQFSATYDTAGRIKHQVDGLNNFTETTFDYATSQAATSSVPKANGSAIGAKSNMIYDSAGNLIQLTDPEGNATVWAYDGLNRPQTETVSLPSWDTNGDLVPGQSASASRNWIYNGLTTIYTDRNGRTITSASNPNTRTSAETWSDGRTITATSNAAGQLQATVDTSGTKAWTQGFVYDNLGRLDTNNFNFAVGGTTVYATLADHGYTATGVRNDLSFTLNGVERIHQTAVVDDLNRITSLTQDNGGSGPDLQVAFTYRADSSLASLQRNEITGIGTTPIASTDFSYFTSGANIGELQTISHQYQAGGVIATQYDYTYDAVHRIQTFTSSRDGLITYGYDAQNQLQSADAAAGAAVPDENFTYDENGNRTVSGYVTGLHNLLLSDGTYNYQYDKEGNRIRRSEISGTEVVTYAWDHRNRLTRVTFMDGTAETKRVEYDYNGANLRIEKRVSTNGGTSWTIERYALDGGDVLLTFDATNTAEHTYFHGPAVDQIFADENAMGEILWALSDHQGTVRDWIDAGDANINAGTPTQHVTYSAFGEILSATDPATLPDYAYTGREWDADADLYYYRNRWFDPTIGKFASDDPSGVGAGDSNLQRYVGNNSPNAVDPSGLEKRVKLNPSLQAADAKFARESDAKRRPQNPNRWDNKLVNQFYTFNKWLLTKATEIIPRLNPTTTISHLSPELQTQVLQAAPGSLYDSIMNTKAADDLSDMVDDQRNHGEYLPHWSVIRGAMREQGLDVPIATPIPHSQSGIFPATMSLIHHPVYAQRRFEAGDPNYTSSTGDLLVGLTETAFEVSMMASELRAAKSLQSIERLTPNLSPRRGPTLYWHGSTEGVGAATRNGLFAHGTGNGSKFWATTRGEQGALTEILVGGNRNIESLIPFRTSTKGGFESVYRLTAEEASHFSRAWGFSYSFNPWQWYKGVIGQYVYHPGSVSWAQRGLEARRGLTITGAGVGGAIIVDQGIEWWNQQ